MSLTACPSPSHHKFPDWCPQASGSERVKCPERGADGRTSEQQCWNCNSRYLPAAWPSQVPPGTPLQLPPQFLSQQLPSGSAARPLPHPGVRILLFPPAGEGPALPSTAARSKSCLDSLMAAIICSALFFSLFLGLSKTFLSVSFKKKNFCRDPPWTTSWTLQL